MDFKKQNVFKQELTNNLVSPLPCISDITGGSHSHTIGVEGESSETLIFLNKVFYSESDSDITRPSTWNEYQRKLERFVTRIEDCKYMSWTSLVCENCGEVVKKDCAKLSCLSPFCQDEECIKNRIRIAMAYFKALKIYSKNLLHIVFGFEHTTKFTETENKNHSKVFRLLKKEMQKLGTPLHMIIARDLTGEKFVDLYIHYHTANLPVKDWRKFRQNLFRARDKIIKKTGIQFSIKFKHYRRMYGLFKYFSNRIAGVFGDLNAGRTYGYAQLMDIKEFFDCFYKTRKIRLINLRAPEGSSVLAFMLDNLTTECPYCHSKQLKLTPNELIEKPPDRICRECGLSVSKEHYFFEPGLCVFCYQKTTPEYKTQQKQKEFLTFLNKNSR